ncbi:SDR family oxidoreductase (plasmid) [Skermanella rosea]|uniref:SDR family NAD(P)-dependent oxidoreductase n=1 Tax=Skermanella rosea TaxID=1817965 RepID=UPI00193127CE|nr:SDR family oxidoreductase [Skermanella rosea]UEM07156.1 SDR family oxidoreductase [Skermanella rosea]
MANPDDEQVRHSAYVTGGTRGIGWAIAQALAKSGYEVTASSQSEKSVSDCRGRVASGNLTIHPEVADVCDEEAISTSIGRTSARSKGLDLLVCCAGGAFLGNGETLSMADWDRCMDLNLRAAFFCAKTAIPLMRQTKHGGVIIFVSSIWAHVTPPDRAAYATAKAALTTLARTLAIDHAKDGIRVNCVAPGFVDTDLLRTTLTGTTAKNIEDDAFKRLCARHPLGRLVTAEDVANAVVFLAGPGAINITAQTLTIDGGMSTQFRWND